MMYAKGYHMLFALPSLVVCVLSVSFDLYKTRVVSREQYRKKRSDYVLRLSFALCFSTLVLREYLAYVYGLGQGETHVTLGFSPASQQAFTQLYPVLVGTAKQNRLLSITKSYAYVVLVALLISVSIALVTTL